MQGKLWGGWVFGLFLGIWVCIVGCGMVHIKVFGGGSEEFGFAWWVLDQDLPIVLRLVFDI